MVPDFQTPPRKGNKSPSANLRRIVHGIRPGGVQGSFSPRSTQLGAASHRNDFRKPPAATSSEIEKVQSC